MAYSLASGKSSLRWWYSLATKKPGFSKKTGFLAKSGSA